MEAMTVWVCPCGALRADNHHNPWCYKGPEDAVQHEVLPIGTSARLRRLEEALKDVRAKAMFELTHPTGLHATCLSLISKAADKALEDTP